MYDLDPKLKQYATPGQWEKLEALALHGSQRKAAAALGLDKKSIYEAKKRVEAKAARQGYAPEYGMKREVPDGFHLKGQSTLYGPNGETKLVWHKTAIDHARQSELMREAIEALTDDVLPLKAKLSKLPVLNENLLACYPVGDYHLGMLSWAKETGGDWDMKIAEEMMQKAIVHLMAGMPTAATGLIAILGDFFHYDSMVPETPTSKNTLDSDTRPQKMVRAGMRIIRMMIECALERHETVHVIVEIGNHDLFASMFLMEALRALYADEPRVTIDDNPSHFHYYRFGEVLIGTHHGHGVKMPNLPLLMAADRPEDWGKTKHRYWWTGHIHHNKTLHAVTGAEDFVGCVVESFRVLAPEDAFAGNKGYRSIRDMTSILMHEKHGEVARFKFNPAMME